MLCGLQWSFVAGCGPILHTVTPTVWSSPRGHHQVNGFTPPKHNAPLFPVTYFVLRSPLHSGPLFAIVCSIWLTVCHHGQEEAEGVGHSPTGWLHDALYDYSAHNALVWCFSALVLHVLCCPLLYVCMCTYPLTFVMPGLALSGSWCLQVCHKFRSVLTNHSSLIIYFFGGVCVKNVMNLPVVIP